MCLNTFLGAATAPLPLIKSFYLTSLPQKLLSSLEGLPGFERTSFEAVHNSGEQVTSVRLNGAKLQHGNAETGSFAFQLGARVPWSRSGYYLDKRPSFTFDPLFHAGLYYVQEASSMFLEQAVLQGTDTSKPLKVLDLCAAPGGKSTHLQSLLHVDSLLVSNEVIRSRSHVLTDNIIKWGAANVFVTNNDPLAFSRLAGFFDLMVVDAPCSGSGLFRRDEDAIQEWSPANVQLCSQRQQRILASALPALKTGGLLVYSTCSYSAEEDECIADWLAGEMQLEPVQLNIDPQWGIVETVSPQYKAAGYRFYPDKLRGEGLFLCCFRKTAEQPTARWKEGKAEKATAKETAAVAPWLQHQPVEIIRQGEGLHAIPASLFADHGIVSSQLQMVYSGVALGSVMKEKLVPAHALALSSIVSTSIPAIDVSYEDAIRYLQRAEMAVMPAGKGWQLVRYEGWNLGWINVLPNRINNYYPKELRILKQQNDSRSKK